MTDWLNPTDLGGEFRFTAGPKTTMDDETAEEVTFHVAELPHQCGAWTITKDRDPAVAIAAMERFIGEANVALAVLDARAEEASTSQDQRRIEIEKEWGRRIASTLRALDIPECIELIAEGLRVNDEQITNGELVKRIVHSLADRIEVLHHTLAEYDAEEAS